MLIISNVHHEYLVITAITDNSCLFYDHRPLCKSQNCDVIESDVPMSLSAEWGSSLYVFCFVYYLFWFYLHQLVDLHRPLVPLCAVAFCLFPDGMERCHRSFVDERSRILAGPPWSVISTVHFCICRASRQCFVNTCNGSALL